MGLVGRDWMGLIGGLDKARTGSEVPISEIGGQSITSLFPKGKVAERERARRKEQETSERDRLTADAQVRKSVRSSTWKKQQESDKAPGSWGPMCRVPRLSLMEEVEGTISRRRVGRRTSE